MLRRLGKTLAIVLFLQASFGSVAAAEQIHTPKLGSLERKAIVNALRVTVQAKLKRPVVFKIGHLKVMNRWAFLRGTPLQTSGKPMDYRGTPYQAMIEAGMFDDWICALLNRRENQWQVVEYALGTTDVPFVDWAERYRAPPEIFK